MSSNINIINIDATFPIAGQDNSSQGFRDNFTAIKLAFSTATSEISNLQLTSAQLNQTNDFQNNEIVRGKLRWCGLAANNNTSGALGVLDYSQGNYKKVVAPNTTPIVFDVTNTGTNWPAAGTYGQIMLQVVAPNDPAGVSINFTASRGTLYRNTSTTLPYTAAQNSTSMWELWSTDAGNTVFVRLAGLYVS
jgi:hypothetical protein